MKQIEKFKKMAGLQRLELTLDTNYLQIEAKKAGINNLFTEVKNLEMD